MTLEGKEQIEGAVCFKVKMINREDVEIIYFFNSQNYLPIMMQLTLIEGPGKDKVINNYFSDYNEVEGSFIIPLSTKTKVEEMSFQKIII